MTIRIILLVLLLSGTALAERKASTEGMVHSISLPTVQVDLKPGPGREKTAGYCAVCHSLDYITTQPVFPKEKWGEIVTKMVKVFGAPIPQDVGREITEYLGAEYGKSSQ
jgi:hypothetical protein